MDLIHSRHRTEIFHYWLLNFIIWRSSIAMFVNRIILYCFTIITFRLCQTCVRGSIHSDFV